MGKEGEDIFYSERYHAHKYLSGCQVKLYPLLTLTASRDNKQACPASAADARRCFRRAATFWGVCRCSLSLKSLTPATTN